MRDNRSSDAVTTGLLEKSGGRSFARGWPDAREIACVHVVNLSISWAKLLQYRCHRATGL